MAKLKSQKSKKESYTNSIDDNTKTTSTDHEKGPGKFQIDQYKTVGGVAHTRYPR